MISINMADEPMLYDYVRKCDLCDSVKVHTFFELCGIIKNG